ncbi:hypothetical protein ACSBR2_018750 [Camellia fascicularis]
MLSFMEYLNLEVPQLEDLDENTLTIPLDAASRTSIITIDLRFDAINERRRY